MEIHNSPFLILGATLRDNRRRILDLAEDKQLELESEVCQKARSDLTNPRTRLSAELAWLPGVSPRKAEQMLDKLRCALLEIRSIIGLPKLAHLNLTTAALSAVSEKGQAGDALLLFVEDIAYLVESIDLEELLSEINEDRKVSGFPEVRSIESIEAEWAERKRYYRGVIRNGLDRLPSIRLIQVMRKIVADMTDSGKHHAPELIHELVDVYEVEVNGAMEKDAKNIRALIQVVRENAGLGEGKIALSIKNMEYVVRHWLSIAKPILLSSRARGSSHDASRKLAYEIRNFGIDLYNKYDMLNQSKRVINFLLEEFSDLVGFSDLLKKDKADLAEIGSGREQASSPRRRTVSDIDYSVEIGCFFKKRLIISSEGVSWSGLSYSLESIKFIRWGAVHRSINGISQGTKYTVGFGDGDSEALIELGDASIYYTFIEKLWRAVSGRIIIEILNELKAGRAVRFGSAIVTDEGVDLIKPHLFRRDESKLFTWSDVGTWSLHGSFYIVSTSDRRFRVALSYLSDSNIHILECIIQMALKRPSLRRLSELLS